MLRTSRRPLPRLLAPAVVAASILAAVPAAARTGSGGSGACAETAGAKLMDLALGTQQPYFYYATEGSKGRFTIGYDGAICTGGEDATIKVDYDTPLSPPTTSDDYTRATGSVQWTVPDHSTVPPKSLNLPQTTHDTVQEAAAEPIDVVLTGLTGYGEMGSPSQAPMYIVDNDGGARARFVLPSMSSPETVGSVKLPILRGGQDTSGAVGYSIVGSTSEADPDIDLTTAPTGTVTFTADGRLGTIQIGVADDPTEEASESFTVSLTGIPTEAPSQMTFTIEDSDASTMHTLQVQKSGTGSGTVASDPAGISCGADCAEAYAAGTSVKLYATPAPGSIFAGWSGVSCTQSPCSFLMDSPKNVTATFEAESATEHTLTVAKAEISEGGTVTSTPSGINCGTDCSEAYPAGQAVTLTAQAGTGFVFVGWSGACTGTGTCPLTMNTAKNVTATFDDLTAPETNFHHPKHNKTYKRTNYLARTIHVFAPGDTLEPSGIEYAQTALRKTKTNGACLWWNGNGWTPDGCGNTGLHQHWLPTWFFDPWNDKLIYEYPKSPNSLDPLKPSIGTKVKNYFVYSRAEDNAGNMEETFEMGRNKNRFEIAP